MPARRNILPMALAPTTRRNATDRRLPLLILLLTKPERKVFGSVGCGLVSGVSNSDEEAHIQRKT
jgi:hypothetical protein